MSLYGDESFTPRKSVETQVWESIFGQPEDEIRFTETMNKLKNSSANKYGRGHLGLDAQMVVQNPEE